MYYDVFVYLVIEVFKVFGLEYLMIFGGFVGSVVIIFVIVEFFWFFGYFGGML